MKLKSLLGLSLCFVFLSLGAFADQMVLDKNFLKIQLADGSFRFPDQSEIFKLIDQNQNNPQLLKRVFGGDAATAKANVKSLFESNPNGAAINTDGTLPEDLPSMANVYNQAVYPQNGATGSAGQSKILLATASGAGAAARLDEALLKQFRDNKAACLKGNKDSSASTMYDALAEVLSNKNCTLDSVAPGQQMLTRSLNMPAALPDICKKLNIGEANNSSIGTLNLALNKQAGNGTNTIKWDANHLAEMTKDDWLNGKSGHQGFYPQLVSKGICDTPIPGTRTETVTPVRDGTAIQK